MWSVSYVLLIILYLLQGDFSKCSALPTCYYGDGERSNCVDNIIKKPHTRNDLIDRQNEVSIPWGNVVVVEADKQKNAAQFLLRKLLKFDDNFIESNDKSFLYDDDDDDDDDGMIKDQDDDDDGTIKDQDDDDEKVEDDIIKSDRLAKRTRYYQKYPRKRQQSKDELEPSYPQCIPTPKDTMNLILAVHQIRRGVYPNYVPFCNHMRDARVILPNPRFLGKRNKSVQ